jgi:hypothetical protein
MGTRGPIPKAASERRRRNRPDPVEIVKLPTAATLTWADPDPAWNPLAARLYRSLGESGQSRYYQASDAAFAALAAHVTSIALERKSGTLMACAMQMWSALLADEASRRRLRLELQRGEPEPPPSVGKMRKYRVIAAQGQSG